MDADKLLVDKKQEHGSANERTSDADPPVGGHVQRMDTVFLSA